MNSDKSKQKNIVVLFSKVVMLSLGVLILALSAIYGSSLLAVVSISLLFWGLLLFYFTPSKHVPLSFLSASTNTNMLNIERVLKEYSLTERGVYLPPKNLEKPDDSLVFIPKSKNASLPLADGNANCLSNLKGTGCFVTPPGLGLTNLMEKELGLSFLKIDLEKFPEKLTKVLTELEMAKATTVSIDKELITVEVFGSIFNDFCREIIDLHSHDQVGCLLTSAIACALAKSSGKSITIWNETEQDDCLRITYIMRDEE